VQRLSGDEALVYVRSRRLGGDLDRARRQQRFIWAIRNQVLNENILTRLPALYNAVSDSDSRLCASRSLLSASKLPER